MIFCSTPTAPCSSCLLTCPHCLRGAITPIFGAVNAPGRLWYLLLASLHTKAGLCTWGIIMGPGSAPGHLLPPCFSSSLPYWQWIARRALHTSIRKTRLLQKSSLPSPWIFTSPCHTAKSSDSQASWKVSAFCVSGSLLCGN